MKHELRRVACDAIEAPAAPGRVQVLRWGDNKRRDGQVQIIDARSAQDVLAELQNRAVDVVVDYEHASAGGEFARPDGLAPAAGWLKNGSFEAVPGEGIYARVEWTADAARMIANKQYRYLSPVVWVDKQDKVRVLDTVALTNTPAIRGFPALINSHGAGAGSPAAAPERIEAMENIAKSLGLAAEATEDQIVAKCGELVQLANAGKTASETLAGLAKAAKVEGDDPAQIGEALTAVINKAAAPAAPGMVPAEKLVELSTEIERLKTARQADAYQALINKHPGKIAPADEAWFKPIFESSPEQAEKILNGMPKKVATAGDADSGASGASGAGAGAGDRKVLINKARASYQADRAAGQFMPGTERSYVHGCLRAAGLQGVSDEEAKSLALVG